MTWTDERVDEAKRLCLEGATAQQIADHLGRGVTRNAVIGKLRRLGMGCGAVKRHPKREETKDQKPKRRTTTPGNPFKVGDRVRVNAYGIGSGMRPRRGVVTSLRDILDLDGTFERHGVAVVFDGNKTATNMAACFVEAVGDDAEDDEFAPRSKPGVISFTPTRRERLIASREAVERYAAAAPADEPLPQGIGIPFLDRRISQCAEILNSPSAETVMCCGERVEHEKSSYCPKHAAKNYARPVPKRREAGSRPPSMWDDPARVEWLRALRDAGKTQREAAEAMGIGLTSVERATREHLGGWARVAA